MYSIVGDPMHLKEIQDIINFVFSHDSYLLEYNGLFNHFGYFVA